MKTAYIDCTEYGFDIIQKHALMDRVPGMLLQVGDPDNDALHDLLNGASAIINGHTLMDDALLARCDALKTIVFLGTGASSYIDMQAAARRNIDIVPIQGYGDRTNAEHAFAMILAASRNIAGMDRSLRHGAWDTQMGMELQGKRLGVIGTGRIGAELIKIANAFGMEVVAWNRSPIPKALPCTQLELPDLLASSDVVSIHLSLNDATTGILDKAKLAMLKPEAIVVNCARGALIDETALIEMLQAGRIRHAALDVFATEPLPAGHILTQLENVTLTSHAAFSSHQAMVRLLTMGFEALEQAIKTQRISNC